MGQRIAGPGMGLPIAQNYFPHLVPNASPDVSTNILQLSPGDVFYIPAGEFMVQEGNVSMLQWLDPVTNIWRNVNGLTCPDGQKQLFSDGYNYRIANLTACVVSATVAGGGTSFTQATAAIAASVGGSTWQPIVGGSLSVVTITNPGANYSMPPIVAIPSGPVGLSCQATANATLANGTVSAITFGDVGAGYTLAPAALVLIPNPADPNLGTITNATISMGLINAGKITAALCTSNGTSLSTANLTAMTLTASGGSGSGATITPNVLQCVTGVTITGAGTGYNAANKVISVGGTNLSVSAIGNPATELGNFIPRPADLEMTITGGTLTSVAAIYNNGLFLSKPTPLMINNTGVAPTAAATIAFIMGGIVDTVMIQPN